MLRKERTHVDVVTIDGRTSDQPAGAGRRRVEDEAKKRFPAPVGKSRRSFDDWFSATKTEIRTWKAEFISDGITTPIELGENVQWKWGVPTIAILHELDRLQSEGWTLLNVSEDRGLYQGADADREGYVTRARYLLGK
jgi:hypothetical protein